MTIAERRHRGGRVFAPWTAADFWARVDKSDGCWLWTGRLDEHGYGRIGFFRRRNLGAHRVAYALDRNGGALPTTRVRHACSNRACVNPDHLSAGALS